MINSNPKFVFFGGEPLGVPVLEALYNNALVPSLIICNPDRPVGRKQVITPPPVKVWAMTHNIPVWQPENFNDESVVSQLISKPYDLFVVVAYNHILPKVVIEHPTHGTLNLHPSLLPLLRGASPIRTSILKDMQNTIGVSVMLLDEKMDHGPILAQEKISIDDYLWPIPGHELDELLAVKGADLLVDTIPKWLEDAIIPQIQDDTIATYSSLLTREDGRLDLNPLELPINEKARDILLKIRAFDVFPGTFFIYKNKRIKIADAEIINNKLVINSVIPEGKQKQPFAFWLQTVVNN